MTEAAGDHAPPPAPQPVSPYPATEPQPGEVCQYAIAHVWAQIPAVTVLDCGVIGLIPACQRCADFYDRSGGRGK